MPAVRPAGVMSYTSPEASALPAITYSLLYVPEAIQRVLLLSCQPAIPRAAAA